MNNIDWLKQMAATRKNVKKKNRFLSCAENIESLEKKVQNIESTSDYIKREKDKAEGELNALHAAFDSLGIPRNIEVEDYFGGCSKQALSLQSRFIKYY